MRQKKYGEGTKIAQAAKDLNVTSVTIRRYITEFDIATTADENGIKVLPSEAMEELYLIRQLKEDGLTNPKVMEHLEEHRRKAADKPRGKEKDKEKDKEKAEPVRKTASKRSEKTEDKEAAARTSRSRAARAEQQEEPEEFPPAAALSGDELESEEPVEREEQKAAVEAGEGRSKHTLTCQTCSKVFEHMNPRLRDCLDCYRAKRKERRRGGDKHKNVIQHPLAQQVLNRTQQAQAQPANSGQAQPATAAPQPVRSQTTATATPRHQVRSYRKAIEETRQITSNLKRRLERPDLPEAERRWLEQIYAYQLILHQGWRHLAEYKAGTQQQREKE